MQIQVKGPQTVMDPYEWLPSYGEKRIESRYDGAEAVILITYNHPSEKGIQFSRELHFFDACLFSGSCFPGPGSLNKIISDKKWEIGALIEFEYSDLSDAWNSQLQSLPIRKHFLIQFTSENLIFQAIASAFDVTEERKC